MLSKLETLMADHAVGSLDPGRSLVVQSVAALKPEIADELSRFETAGAALLAAIQPVPLPVGGLGRLMERLDHEAELPHPAAPALAEPDIMGLPEPLRRTLGRALEKSHWRWRLPGVQTLDLAPGLPGLEGTAELVRVRPRRFIPAHRHGGEELILVLAGSYTDETGRYRAGDLAFNDPSLVHKVAADPGIDCLCLIVSDAPPVFTGLFGAVSRALSWRGH